jgi:hypothetical protein
MTNPDTSVVQRPPGRRWYLVAALIAIAGWTAMAVFLVSRIGDSTGRMIRLLAPGQTEIVLKEPGTYTIFHEYQSTFEGRVYDVAVVSGLTVSVRTRPGGEEVPLSTATGTRYRVGSYAGRSLFNFEVRAPGSYQIAATYDGGRKEPQTVLAVDRGFFGDFVLTILGALAMAFAGMGAAVAICVLVFLNRRRARMSAGRP